MYSSIHMMETTPFNSQSGQWGCLVVIGYAGSKLNELLGMQASMCVCAGSCMLIQAVAWWCTTFQQSGVCI